MTTTRRAPPRDDAPVTVTGARATRAVRRDLRIDAVRGVALVSMYLAHCAPSAGPGHVIILSEYATYPLFALLVGVGAELGARSAARAWWVGPLVRGAALLVAAQVVEGWGAQIFIVLAHLGVLTWLTAPLVRAPSPVVAGVGLGSLLVAPHLYSFSSGWTVAGSPGGETTFRLARFLVADWPYQIVAMVFFAAVGILLTRYVLRPTHVTYSQRLTDRGCVRRRGRGVDRPRTRPGSSRWRPTTSPTACSPSTPCSSSRSPCSSRARPACSRVRPSRSPPWAACR